MKLFRKMRAHSIEQGNGADYWKYAVGEIVFVVVGILLAFQIDTWSEQRNAQEHTQYLFGQVQEELVLNIENCTYQIASYRFTDTLVKNILTGEVDREDFRDHPPYAIMLLSQARVEVVDDAFLNLVNSEDALTPVQRDILRDLKALYGPTKRSLESLNEMTTNAAFNYHEEYKRNHTWYAELVSDWSVPEGMIDFCLEDPSYINSVAYFQFINLLNHNRNAQSFRQDALELHERLAEDMNLPMDTTLLFPLSECEDALGTYVGPYLLEVVMEDGKLIGKKKRKDNGVVFEERRMFPEARDEFSFSRRFCRLVRDTSNEVSGLTISLGTFHVEFTKEVADSSSVEVSDLPQ